MSKPNRPVEWLVWGALGLTIVGVAVAFIWQRIDGPLRGVSPLPILFQVPDFTLTNQHNRPVTLADLRGQVWLVDVIFTSCAGPCPEMTRKMGRLQAALPSPSPVQVISITTDPGTDTPAVLHQYAQSFGAEPARWHFLTGTKPQIARLAVDGLKFTALEKEPGQRTNEADLFIHSTTIVLVDRQGRVRGSFETEPPDAPERILRAVKQLLREK